MQRITFLVALFITSLGVASASPLAGTWRLLPERSTDLSGWKALDLTIGVEGDVVTMRVERLGELVGVVGAPRVPHALPAARLRPKPRARTAAARQ